jgi:kumamolisin
VAYVVLAGSNRALLPGSTPVGPVDTSEIASLTVRVRSQGDLEALARTTYDEAGKPLSQRTYLSHEEFASQYGASKEDLDAIEAVAQRHDLMVVHRSGAERSVVLRGRLADLLAAFPADLHLYHHPTGVYRGRQGEISVPVELGGIVTGVFGFDTRRKRRHSLRYMRSALSGPGGSNGVAATDFAKRYSFPTTSGGIQLDGTGQTIAIIELGGGYRASDLQAFFQEIGNPVPSVTAISVDHAGNSPTTPDSADGEVMLDVEVAGAVAPNAQIAIYFGPGDQGDKGFLDTLSAAIHDTQRNPGVVSISWGAPEDSIDAQAIQQYHELFVAAASLGITVCAASGDHGVADEVGGQWDQKVHVDHPAADDQVLGCGGTQIDNGVDVVWNDGTTFDASAPGGGGWTGGGGISRSFAVPSYQQGISMPASLAGGGPGRGVPDIAMSATNYFTRVDSMEGPSGGTSAVAPLMAALVALLNQAKGKNVGFLNPFLYTNASKGLFTDVTSGNNGIASTVQGYSAGPGWDACSGLGTPIGQAILDNL